MAQNRNLFRLTRFVIFKVSQLFRFLGKFRKPAKRILIIKTDAIGDYILFRNFIEVVSRSEKFKDHEVDLFGNTLWQDLALKFDGPFVNRFFFTNPEALYYAPLKTFKLGWQLYTRNYEAVLQPTYSRTLINDGIAGLAAAKQVLGFESDTERIYPKYKIKTDKFYTEKLPLPQSVFFEFDRSRFFFETVLKQVVDLYGPYLPVNEKKNSGVVIFPGAGVVKRSWEREKFVELIRLIKANSSEQIILAGGPAEAAIGDYLMESFPAANLSNQINQTSLTELVELIANAKIIVSNETSAIHIAAATQTKAICILGGGHFGRFAPYPAYIENAPVCVYHPMECFNCNWICIFETPATAPYPCIGNVSLAAVWTEVQKHLQSIE